VAKSFDELIHYLTVASTEFCRARSNPPPIYPMSLIWRRDTPTPPSLPCAITSSRFGPSGATTT
jgi:hypothetical protein